MHREFTTPTDEAHWHAMRAQDLTSTDVAALFGLSPYKTKFELYHEKKAGEVVRIKDNDRMRWGRRLEPAVAEGIAEEQGWVVRPFKEYGRIPAARLGASFDYRVVMSSEALSFSGPTSMRVANIGPGAGTYFDTPDDAILEIKTVDFLAFRNGWTIEDDYVEAPAHIELQVQHQMLVSGLRLAYIGVLIGGNRIEVLRREADDQVHAGIIAAATGFWESIAAGRPPEPVMPGDADALIRMNAHAEPGKLYDATADAIVAQRIAEYAALKRQAKGAEEQAKALKAELLLTIGDAEKVLLNGYSVSAGIVAPSPGTLVTPEMVGTYVGGRSGYRDFRVTAKKGAK